MASYSRSARTKKQIFDAAHSLFVKQGYSATSLSDICRAADVAKGTLYNHYPQKSDLLIEAQHLSVERLEEFAKSIPTNLSLEDRICALAEEDVRGVSQGFDRTELTEGGPEMDLALASLAEMYTSIDRLREEHTIRRKLRHIYEGFITDAIVAGELAPKTDATAVAALVVAVYFQEIEFLILRPSFDFESDFRTKIHIVVNGCK